MNVQITSGSCTLVAHRSSAEKIPKTLRREALAAHQMLGIRGTTIAWLVFTKITWCHAVIAIAFNPHVKKNWIGECPGAWCTSS